MKHISSVVKVGALTVKRSTLITAAAALSMAGLAPLIASMQAGAAPLTSRSLMVTSTNPGDDDAAPDGSTYTWGAGANEVPAGDPRNGARVGHTYTFTTSTAENIESFTFEVCDSAFGYAGTCTVPAGYDQVNMTGMAVDVTVDGTPDSGWAVTADNGVNEFTVAKTGANTIAAGGETVEIKLTPTETSYITNPSDAYRTSGTNGTYFVHIISHNDDIPNSPTTDVDEGTVTNSVASSVKIYTRVQETLNFSVEADADEDQQPSSVVAVGGTCTPLNNDNTIYMGDGNNALASDTAYDAYSFFRLATNSANGVSVYYSGDTLKSGTEDITQIGDTMAVSAPGTEQFGLGIDTSATGYAFANMSAAAQYGSAAGAINGTPVASFAFNNSSIADPIAIASSSTIVDCETGAVRYIANIDVDTAAGIYQTKINYIASPSY